MMNVSYDMYPSLTSSYSPYTYDLYNILTYTI